MLIQIRTASFTHGAVLEGFPAVADVVLERAEEGRPEQDHLVLVCDVDVRSPVELKRAAILLK